MESVLQQIRQARGNKKSVQADIHVYETVVNGCQVKMRFNNDSDSTIMESIRSTLLSARFDFMLTNTTGGEPA